MQALLTNSQTYYLADFLPRYNAFKLGMQKVYDDFGWHFSYPPWLDKRKDPFPAILLGESPRAELCPSSNHRTVEYNSLLGLIEDPTGRVLPTFKIKYDASRMRGDHMQYCGQAKTMPTDEPAWPYWLVYGKEKGILNNPSREGDAHWHGKCKKCGKKFCNKHINHKCIKRNDCCIIC